MTAMIASSVRGHRVRNRSFAVLVAVLLSGLWPGDTAADPYEVVINHAPPYRIIEEKAGVKTYSGFYIDFVRELAKRRNLDLVFHEAPFRRALALMEQGVADIMTGPNRTPERESFMTYLDVELTREGKAFYLQPEAPDITGYDDLASRYIGVLRGAKYFERFDGDENLRKYSVGNYSTALRMVSKGRIDVAIMPELLGDYLNKSHSFGLRKASFKVPGLPSYIAVSKKSKLARSIKELETALREMKADGTVDRIIGRYR